MINILEKGDIHAFKIPIFKLRCNMCATLFEFTSEDMYSHFRRFNGDIGTVKCPLCEMELTVRYENIDRRVVKQN